MDFFGAQDQARRRSAFLIFYFALAVASIVGAVYAAVLLLVVVDEPPLAALWRPELFALTAPAIVLLIGGGSAYKIAALARGGGASVAESLGGRLVLRRTTDAAERRLLNVVDEMAIASGVAAPPVYVLEDEPAINAFAAGSAPNEAIVAVTRGALAQLSRDELQGVIAHEFSHILNGDMRLNLRLMGVLHGILLVALLGRGILRGAGRGRGRNAGGAVVFGLALVLIGYVGVFFGRLIKAGVSRQREFLADASAVQFTRNPPGIAGALKKIAGVSGSRVSHSQAEEASHLFFGEGIPSLFGWFATHPPLAERIRRLDPAFNPALVIPPAAVMSSDGQIQPGAFAAAAGTVGATHMAYARALIATLPEPVSHALREPVGARALIYSLLLAADPGVAHAQLTVVAAREGESLRAAVEANLDWVRRAGASWRLPLVDLALPVLRELADEERTRFLEVTDRLVRADRRLDLFEYTLQRILARHLAPNSRKPPSHQHPVQAIQADCGLLLSCLAYVGNRGEAVRSAFKAAAMLAPLGGPWEIVPREAVTLAQLDGALSRLATLVPGFKRRLVEACAAAVSSDRKVTVGEGELLRAVCEVLEVPMPPLLALAENSLSAMA